MELKPLLTHEETERLMTSFIEARIRREQPYSEEECGKLCQWATLVLVKYETLRLFFEGELEIEEFANDDIQFVLPETVKFHTPLLNQMMEQLGDKFENGSAADGQSDG